MKAAISSAILCLLALCQGALAAKLRGADVATEAQASAAGVEAKNPMSQIVTLLEEMLKKSEDEGEADKKAYAKFKCYCDDNTDEKTTAINDATKAIGLLQNAIGGLQGENGATSTEAAKLKSEMDENEQAVEVATGLREKEEEAFKKFEADMTESIPMLEQAIEVLGEIGADQTLADSKAHEQFMGGYDGSSLVGLQSTVQKALAAAAALEIRGGHQTPSKWKRLESLLQGKAPLGTTYETQSGEIVGILRQMKETFEDNLKEATDAEDAAKKAHEKLVETKGDEFKKLEKAYNDGQDILAENDGSLSAKKTELETEIETKGDAEDFLAKLEPMCADKAKEYDARKLFRTNEQAAISKAIALLNSDAAFKTFSKVKATGGAAAASLVQLSARRGHAKAAAVVQRRLAATSRLDAERVLFRAAHATKSIRLAKIASELTTGNPFTKVIKEIENMKEVIEEEGEADKKKKEWCEGEQSANTQTLGEKESAVTTLKDTEIPELEDSIDNPETGFKATIEEKEVALEQNTASMKEETEMRREENADYQVLAANAAEARELLEKAIAMLEKYYAELKDGFLQRGKKEDPAPPDTWESGTMNTEAENTEVVTMLKTVLTETETEEQTAHETEASAQASYEESMGDLKQTEADLQEEMGGLHELLAEAEETLIKKRAELKQTEREATAIERYLEQIKPGCDWIIDNYDAREGFRTEETAALDKAVELITATPAYATAKANEKFEKYGKCKDTCIDEGEDHAKCLACNAKVSVAGYCAGHAGVPGC